MMLAVQLLLCRVWRRLEWMLGGSHRLRLLRLHAARRRRQTIDHLHPFGLILARAWRELLPCWLRWELLLLLLRLPLHAPPRRLLLALLLLLSHPDLPLTP